MSFKRHGDKSEMQVMKFRCLSCGSPASFLKNGRCNMCNLNDEQFVMDEEKPKKKKRNKN